MLTYPDYETFKVNYSKTKKLLYICKRITINERYEPDKLIEEHVLKFSEKLDHDLDVICGYTEVPLEGRFNFIRTEETNLGNLIADIIRSEYDTDFGLVNSGTLRTNNVIEKGPIKLRSIMNLLPMIDIVVIIKVTGLTFKEALENGVS